MRVREPSRCKESADGRRCRARLLVLLAVAVAGLLVVAVAQAVQVPLLGRAGAFTSGEGFGHAKPRVVSYGGDSTTYFSGITWHNWGQTTSDGYGQGFCPPLNGGPTSDGHPCKAELIASSLGPCRGHLAYRYLTVRVDEDGWRSFFPKRPICGKTT